MFGPSEGLQIEKAKSSNLLESKSGAVLNTHSSDDVNDGNFPLRRNFSSRLLSEDISNQVMSPIMANKKTSQVYEKNTPVWDSNLKKSTANFGNLEEFITNRGKDHFSTEVGNELEVDIKSEELKKNFNINGQLEIRLQSEASAEIKKPSSSQSQPNSIVLLETVVQKRTKMIIFSTQRKLTLFQNGSISYKKLNRSKPKSYEPTNITRVERTKQHLVIGVREEENSQVSVLNFKFSSSAEARQWQIALNAFSN